MAIPDFQTIMLPLIRHLQDGQEHTTSETLDALAKHVQDFTTVPHVDETLVITNVRLCPARHPRHWEFVII